jgi:hypothetical protein
MAPGGGRLTFLGTALGGGTLAPMEAPGSESARRCPSCGALASTDAEWCGQCFTVLPSDEPPAAAVSDADPASVASGTVEAPHAQDKALLWPCPACGNENPIALDACSVCGTSFATLMRSDEVHEEVDPRDALVASLIFPGLGQRKLGRPLDGFARGALFVILCSLALILAFANGSGVLKAMFVLYLLLALGVYLGSAYEAHRMAGGAVALVSTRQLLWGSAIVVIASVFVLAMSAITVAKR